MCFLLYAGTVKPLPRGTWSKDAREVHVVDLNQKELAIAKHFSAPEVQYIGSTSGCGCDFPHLMFQNGGWPYFEGGDTDPERETSDQLNLERLTELLKSTGEGAIELYGVWSADFSEPKSREEIDVSDLLKSGFHFKEQGFYTVKL